MIGVLGASGGVGSAAAEQLHAWGIGPLRLGARGVDALRALGLGDPVAVDAGDERRLEAFCSGCRIVLNCAGPSARIGDRVARAALRAGADYVDAGGDEPLHALLHEPGAVAAGRTALISAGTQPGLSGLLVRALTGELSEPRRLIAYCGGLGRFTPGAAEDYLSEVGSTAGTPLAAWRGGRRSPGALTPAIDLELEHFPGRISAHPYLSAELERVASATGLVDADWYTVFAGEHVLRALEQRPAPGAGPAALGNAARRLSAAAELDLFGREPYQLFWLCLDDGHGDGLELVCHADGPIRLTGAMAALGVVAVLEGWAGTGAAFAGEAIDPGPALQRLTSADAVTALVRIPLRAAAIVEEGVL